MDHSVWHILTPSYSRRRPVHLGSQELECCRDHLLAGRGQDQALIRDKLDDAAGMWTKLKEQYSQDSASARFLLLDEFLSISKQADESLTGLCARVEDSLQKVKGSCSASLTLSLFQEELAMMALIRSLLRSSTTSGRLSCSFLAPLTSRQSRKHSWRRSATVSRVLQSRWP